MRLLVLLFLTVNIYASEPLVNKMQGLVESGKDKVIELYDNRGEIIDNAKGLIDSAATQTNAFVHFKNNAHFESDSDFATLVLSVKGVDITKEDSCYSLVDGKSISRNGKILLKDADIVVVDSKIFSILKNAKGKTAIHYDKGDIKIYPLLDEKTKLEDIKLVERGADMTIIKFNNEWNEGVHKVYKSSIIKVETNKKYKFKR